MTRATVWRVLTALLVLGVTGFFAITKDPQLGLDLRGGVQIVLETQDSATTEANAESTDRAVEVLRNRVDALGVAEPTLARSGERRIIVELPGLEDASEAENAVGRTAQLTFHPVLGPGDPADLPEADRPEDADPEGTTAEPTAAPPDPSAPPAASPSPTSSPQADDENDVAAEGEVELFNPTVEQTVLDDTGNPIRIAPAELTGDGVGDASVFFDPTQQVRAVTVEFRGDGGSRWEQLTADAACNEIGQQRPDGDPMRRVAIVLDGEVISSPQVDPRVPCVGIVGGSTQITGNFTQEEAADLAALIQGGALPVPVDILSSSTVGPTLGEEAIDASFSAGLIGISLTGLFLIFIYRLMGLLATVALATYGVISYGTLVAIGATLTLPGLAGFLLSAGLAIDANVLVFERAREEFAGQRTRRLRSSLGNGFNKALSAIADSNITTILAAVLLFFLATGPVRGFGVTLIIGVLASLVSALLVTRALTDVFAGRWLDKRARLSGLASLGRVRTWLTRRDPQLMARRSLWLTISAVLVVLALAGIVGRGLNFGVEFTGGRLLELSTTSTVDVDDARAAVADAGFPEAVVQRSGQDDITVRTRDISDEDAATIRAAIGDVGGGVDLLRDETVGPTLGEELRNKALIALAVALLAQLVYLAVRFRWTFATGTVLAMLHDVLVVVGIFAWLGKPIDAVFLAAALTIIGVSVNDSIVTLDRVRELWGANRTKPLPGLANSAILQTAPRTINTGLGAMFILAALTFLGGSSLTNFAFALLLGLVIGTYSSPFTATPLMLLFERWNKAPAPMPKRKPGYSSAPSRKRGPQPIFQARGGGAVR
jgi:SecD/SecF fusion protein